MFIITYIINIHTRVTAINALQLTMPPGGNIQPKQQTD